MVFAVRPSGFFVSIDARLHHLAAAQCTANIHHHVVLQMINPSETFGDILIDYSYVELSSTCIAALGKFSKKYPHHRGQEIKKSQGRGRQYILSMQRSDGSWYGNWGVCFTYAAWFG